MSVKSNALILTGAAVVLAGFVARAAEPVPPSSPAAGTNAAFVQGVGPRIEFAAPFFDFDRVQSGKLVSHDFIFTNTGDQALEISDVQSSCGCAAATNWDMRIEPGKAGNIPVLFNSGGMAGPVEKTLWVICNDPDHPNVRLGFSATIWKFIDAIPAGVTFTFGPDFQTNETHVIRLISNLTEPVTLSAPLCTNHSFKAELKTVHKGKEFELLVTVVPPLGPGSLVAPITLHSSSSQMPVVTVTAYALVQPTMTVMPPRIKLPEEPLAGATRFDVKIRNNGTHPLVLSAPSINAKGASVQLREVQPGQLFELAVTLPAGFQSHAGQLVEARVKSNTQQSPVVKVPVIQLQPFATD